MSMNQLIEKIVKTNNPTVAGLDPKLEFVPAYIKEAAFKTYGTTLKGAAEALLSFNKELIDSLAGIVPALKPQSAYYEMYGYEGVRVLYETIAYGKSRGFYVIVDGKRNDIGTTMEAYANAYLGSTKIQDIEIPAFQADCLTVNGYLGTDGIEPLLQVCKGNDKDIFVLVKTSNPSSGELQDKLVDDKKVYEIMGIMCEQWGNDTIGRYGYSAVGAVVGATYPAQLEELRKKMPHTFFLVPGYGAQGGAAKDVSYAFDKNGLGALINSSRNIMCAYKSEKCPDTDFANAAAREAIRMRDSIIAEIGTIQFPN